MYSCLFAVLFKESGDYPPSDGSAPDDEPAKETREESQVPREVLDFSSGSEEDEEEQGLTRKMSKPSAVGGNRGGNVTVGPGRLSLHQHGFSELFESVKEKPALEGHSSPSDRESHSEEDAKDQKEEDTSCSTCNAGNYVVPPPKFGTKTCDVCSSSDKEDWKNREESGQKGVSQVKHSDETTRKRQYLKEWTNEKTTKDEESGEDSSPDKKKPTKLRTVPKVNHFEAYSDESEDLDLEIMTRPKEKALDSHCEGGDRRRQKLYCRRKRQNTNVGNKARSKCSEDIEMFTSSEDEHAPFKKGRTGCHFTPAQTERSIELPKYGRSAGTTQIQAGMSKPFSVTSVRSPTSPASKGKDGTIDSVLGQAQYTFPYAQNFKELNFIIIYVFFLFKGAVQEVMYTHSNQRVVGGSKAEEMISRAAVRDVFERKIYSQLPANHILDNTEVHTMSY